MSSCPHPMTAFDLGTTWKQAPVWGCILCFQRRRWMADEAQIPGEPNVQDENGLSSDAERNGAEHHVETSGDGEHSAAGNGEELTFDEHALALSVEYTGHENQLPALPYPVVGFGASAGGLTAFREILENLSADTGMAFVLVTHLAPDQKSYLTEILERYTRIPVQPVVHGTRPEPNHLYVVQPEQR